MVVGFDESIAVESQDPQKILMNSESRSNGLAFNDIAEAFNR